MNNPLVNIWVIAEKDGTIISAHCLGCKAGLNPVPMMISSRLTQLLGAPDCVVREVEGSSPGRTDTHGLKISEENLLPFYNQKMDKYFSLLG